MTALVIIPQPNVGDLTLVNPYLHVFENVADGMLLHQLQHAVGGSVDHIGTLCDDRFGMWINDEGKFDPNCRPNIWATRVAAQGYLGVDDFICGTAVLDHAFPDAGGNTLGVMRDHLYWLTRHMPVDGAAAWLEATA